MKRNMRKTGLFFGAVAIALMMVSSATAVEQVNSEPVMDYITNEEVICEELDDLQEMALDFLQNFDFDGLLMDDNFIDFVNSPWSKEVIFSDEFSALYNSIAVQTLLNTDLFLEYYNSEACQYFIDHLDLDDNELAAIALNLQPAAVEMGDFSSETTTGTTGMQGATDTFAVTAENELELVGAEVLPTDIPPGFLAAFLGLIFGFAFGILTWPLAIIIGFVAAVQYFIEIFSLIILYPGLFFLSVTWCTVMYTITVILGASVLILWPVLIAISSAWIGWNEGFP